MQSPEGSAVLFLRLFFPFRIRNGDTYQERIPMDRAVMDIASLTRNQPFGEG